jgi:MFS family permease
VVGLIEGVAEATASLTKAASGHLSDRRRRRPFVAAGYGLATFGKLLIALATTWPLVLLARFTDRLGKGIRTSPRDALIADVTPPSARGRAFGFHRAMDSAGAVVGPLIGLAVYHAFGEELRPVFLFAVLPALASVGLIAFVHERARPASAPQAARRRWRDAPLDRTYWRTLTFLTLFGLVNFADALLILRAEELGLGISAIFVVYALYNVTYASLSYPAGRLSDRLPRDRIFAVGLAIFAAAYLGLGLITTPAWVWLLLPVYGCYTALTDGVSRAWIVDLTPTEHRGAGLGFVQAATGVASLIAGVWAGLAWGGDGRMPLLISGTVAAALAAFLLLAPGPFRRQTSGAV